MGRKKKFTRKRLEEHWKAYKKYCDEYTVTAEFFNKKTGELMKKTVNRPITYTIEGFCTYIGISRSAFYETYDCETGYPDIVTRAREEAEIDARRKFETGQLSDRLAGLWLGKYGYSTRSSDAPQTDGDGVKRFLSAMQQTKEQIKELWTNEAE